jgi:ribosomal protein S18 acetylase RimI-like enzyme
MIRKIKSDDYERIARLFFTSFYPNDFEKQYFTPERSLFMLEQGERVGFSWFTALQDIGIVILVCDKAIEETEGMYGLLLKSLEEIPLNSLKGLSLISTKKLNPTSIQTLPYGLKRSEIKMIYNKGYCKIPEMSIVTYDDRYFNLELSLESELFYTFRKKHNWKPYRLEDASEAELRNIKAYFNKNKDSFYFYFKDGILVGSILFTNDFIQSLCVSGDYQRKGYGSLLTQYGINRALKKGYKIINLLVFDDNLPAINMYKKIGFDTVRYQYIFK